MNIKKVLLKTVIRACTVSVLLALPLPANAFSGGTGLVENPYLISTPADLDEIRTASAGSHFRLTADLDMTSYISSTYGEMGWLPLTSSGRDRFAGYFHGGRHKIRGLNIDRPETSGVGLFAMLGDGALVDSVGVVGIIIGKDTSLYAHYTDAPAPAPDTVLLTLSISGGYNLLPTFDPYSVDYTVTLECPAADQDITITATARYGIVITYGGAAASDGTLHINASDAGEHIVTITATAEDGGSRTYTITLKQPLPSTLLRRLWMDMIAVNLDSNTNGGYTFTEFQWYKNNRKTIYTGPYLYYQDSLTDGAEYYVVMITSSGATLQTCPYLYHIPAESGISAYPNPVPQGSTVTVDFSALKTLPGSIEIYNSQGVLMRSFTPPKATEFTLQMPYSAGVYIIKAGKYSQKVIITK
jgi:hypothetical protein